MRRPTERSIQTSHGAVRENVAATLEGICQPPDLRSIGGGRHGSLASQLSSKKPANPEWIGPSGSDIPIRYTNTYFRNRRGERVVSICEIHCAIPTLGLWGSVHICARRFII